MLPGAHALAFDTQSPVARDEEDEAAVNEIPENQKENKWLTKV